MKAKEKRQRDRARVVFNKKVEIVRKVMEKADEDGSLTLWDVEKAVKYLADRTPLRAIRKEAQSYVARYKVHPVAQAFLRGP